MKKTEMFKVRGELPVKRFYFNGELKINCDECDKPLEYDFSDQYLSYPEVGSDDSVCFYCNDCDVEHILPIKIEDISISISYDLDKLERDG